MRSPKIPKGAEIVRTYSQYETLVTAFFQGYYNLLIIVGRPGLAKSYSFEQRLGATSHLIKGWAAPLQAYMDCYIHRNKRLIFDDAETLWKRPGGRVLLRSLCEHKTQKLLQWASTARDLIKGGVPQSFMTTSKVALIANRFVFGDAEEYEAVVDRGHLIYFDPSPLEVHVQAGQWFWDQEIFDHVGQCLHLLDTTSSRLYLKARERKRAGEDGKKLIEESFCHDHTLRIVQALEGDLACKTVEERVTKFIKMTGACRATYFNLKRELKDSNQLDTFEMLKVPKIQLRGSPPPEIDVEEEVERARREDEDKRRNNREANDAKQDLDAVGDDDPHDDADWWKRPRTKPHRNPKAPPPAQTEDFGTDAAAPLRRELRQAVEREDYARAAELRDEIRRIEAQERHE